jgi:hypothetical protein
MTMIRKVDKGMTGPEQDLEHLKETIATCPVGRSIHIMTDNERILESATDS